MNTTITPQAQNVHPPASAASRTVAYVALGIAIGAPILWAASVGPLPAWQVTLCVLLIIAAFATEWRVYQSIPWLARPSVAISASTIVASIAVDKLNPADYERYLLLWSVLVAGMIVGSFFTGRTGARRIKLPTPATGSTVNHWAIGTLLVAILSALYFFATQGVPALAGNVEQSRVDAAVEGTGYFRLVAYMAGPATVMLFVTRSTWRFPALIATVLIISGMANRSPFLYLLIPLIFVLTTRSRLTLSSGKILAAGSAVGALIVGFGTFRVFSQDEFAKYAEYRDAIASNDIVSVALTSFLNYAQVVPANQVLTSKLVDAGLIAHQWGASYATLFISALPGEQLSLDRQIREASGGLFVGGGTPPTLAGEGYVNFGLIGTFGAGFFVIALLRFWALRFDLANQTMVDDSVVRGYAAVYGYVLCWVVGSPVAGLAGASTVPLAGALLIIFLRSRSTVRSIS